MCVDSWVDFQIYYDFSKVLKPLSRCLSEISFQLVSKLRLNQNSKIWNPGYESYLRCEIVSTIAQIEIE